MKKFTKYPSTYVKSNSDFAKVKTVKDVRFPANMNYLAILTPDYRSVWEDTAYGVSDIPEEYLDLAVTDRYCAGDEEDPDYGESFVVIVNK